MRIKFNKKLIKDIAKDQGLNITDEEAKEAHSIILDELEDEGEYYYSMKNYFNN